MQFKTEQEALEALRTTISELESLTKSWDKDSMKKAENDGDDMEKSEEEGLEKAEGDMPPPPEEEPAEGAAPAPEGDMSGEPDGDEGQAPAAPEGEEAPAEGDDMMAQVSQEAANLSDEELDMMLHALMQEKDQRMSAGGEGEGAPEGEGDMGGEPAPAPAPEEDPAKALAMSMKAEFKKMQKSFDAQLTDLKKSVNTLSAENAKLKKQAARPTAKPAASNRVEVLEKSVKPVERLSKSEAQNFLLNEQRKGNRTVNSEHVALVGAAKTEGDLVLAYDMLKQAGIEIPVKGK